MALATLSQLKILLGTSLSDTGNDALLQQVLDGAEEAVRTYCKRPGLASPPASYTVYLDGSGTDALRLPHYPVTGTSITVYEDLTAFGGTAANAFSAAPLTEGVDYYLRRDDPTGTYLSLSGIIDRLRSPNLSSVLGVIPGGLPYGTLAGGPASPYWPRAKGSVKVVFSAGYLAGQVPIDLSNAVAQVAAWVKRNGPFGGQEVMASESLGAYSYSLAAAAIGSAPPLGSARQVLGVYRQRVL